MITQLVLPVAGRGKRLLPLTLTTPKPLVPVLGRPLLSYTLEEAAKSGIKDVFMIASPDHESQFRAYLAQAEKEFPSLNLNLLFQHEPWGNGRAVLQTVPFLKPEPFLMRFCDDILISEDPASWSLIRHFDEQQAPVILLERVPMEKASQYGVVDATVRDAAAGLHTISRLVEKPKGGVDAPPPSNLAVVGGYIITPQMLGHLTAAEPNAPKVDDGLLINEAFHEELRRGGLVLGWEFQGQRFDCGNLEGLTKAEEFLGAGNRK